MLKQLDQEFRHQNPTQTLKIHLSCFDSLLIYFWFHVFIIFLPVCSSLQGTFPSIGLSFHLREMPPSSSSEFYPQFRRKASHLSHPDCQAEILLQILFTPSREALLSRILWPTKVRWTGGEERQTSGSRARGGSEEQEGEEQSCSPGCRQAYTLALACSGSSPAVCGWSWTPRWTWPALHPYTSPGPGREGWWTVMNSHLEWAIKQG